MAKSKLKTAFSDRAIRNMSYETRQRLYHQEKDELFRTYTNLPASELQRMHDDLVKKWRV